MNPHSNETISGPALVLAPGHFNPDRAKTAYGLVRGSERFRILGVIDSEQSGLDAGEVVDGINRSIPVFESVKHALGELQQRPEYAVVGITTPGGTLPDYLKAEILKALDSGLHIVNGLHQSLSELPEFLQKAENHGVKLHDIRRSRPLSELKFWKGDILEVRAPRIAVLGTDCALGKRTTARWLAEAFSTRGIRAEMVYTGQTGWMQGHPYGFILDATPNDFVPGELENSVVRCDRETQPEVIFIEGQAAMRLPSGPCGSELLCSAQARGVILQHAPKRKRYHSMEQLPFEPPPLEEEIELIRLYGSRVLALTLNGENFERNELCRKRDELASCHGIPVVCPLEDGVEGLLPPIEKFLRQESTI